ncbi:hypothetical protein Syun_006487 [Stephania yunnanensis]|uniref:DNA-directed RNA polymerase n=1 Tax=Stephania yunnanensis TaxID=152371 RepID=A0AAP0KWS9_9MAGN
MGSLLLTMSMLTPGLGGRLGGYSGGGELGGGYGGFARWLRHRLVLRAVEIKRDQRHGEVRIFLYLVESCDHSLVVENLKKIKRIKGHYNFLSLSGRWNHTIWLELKKRRAEAGLGIKKLFMGEGDQLPLDYTACELNLSFLLGLSCGMIPFANHDHARRVLYRQSTSSIELNGEKRIVYCMTSSSVTNDKRQAQAVPTTGPKSAISYQRQRFLR